MSLLRIYASLTAAPPRCRWVYLETGRTPQHGEGELRQAPSRADRKQWIIPAAELLITRARLPRGAARRAGGVLAYAVEDETVHEPDSQRVNWLGSAGDDDVLAVVDKRGFEAWSAALDAAGLRNYEVHGETLLLPRSASEWSVAWNGRDGFVRTGDIEGAAMDAGNARVPPLTLKLMLEDAARRSAAPSAVAVYEMAPDSTIDPAAWQHERLKPAAWIAGGALAIHAAAVIADWSLLRHEQSTLQRQMETRFRAAVPDAVAVVDPALQMRRKLADARHGAGVSDSGDFLPMIERVAGIARELPPGTLRVAAYEQGRLSLELIGIDEQAARRFAARLKQGAANLETEVTPARGSIVVIVRAS